MPDGRPFLRCGLVPETVTLSYYIVFKRKFKHLMKIDKATSSSPAPLTPNESFFLACWYNLVHEESSDNERVSVLNPMVGLQELLDLYGFGANFGGDQKRLDVGLELRGVLERDKVLALTKYRGIPAQLIAQFSEQNNNSKHEKSARSINKNRVLISSLARQLLDLLETNYIPDTFDLLINAINEPSAIDWINQSKQFENIRQLSEDLASALLWRGAGLWELYSYYRNILVRYLPATPDFASRFNKFREKALIQGNIYEVKFALRSEGLVMAINREGGSIAFDGFQLTVQGGKDTIAVTNQTAVSASTAGGQSFDLLGKVVDALSYTLGREQIVVQKHYLAKDIASGIEKQFSLRKLVPNPVYEYPQEKFARLIFSIGANTGIEGHRDNKILAAFRLYRIGAGSENLEAKFVTYWSALESITRDAAQAGAHDDEKVANAVAPCIVVDYVNKRLTSFLKALRQTNIGVITLDSGQQIDFNTLTNETFFEHLRNVAATDKLTVALATFPYFKFQLSRFSEICQDQGKMVKALNRHHEKVKLQVKRIYRARNIITHTGGKVAGLEFLCAHLEHYLKTCVNSIVDLMFEIPSVKTPEEGLVRYASFLDNIKGGLKQNTDGMILISHLVKMHQ